MSPGLTFRGSWSVEMVPYQPWDVVVHDEKTWVATDSGYWWHIPGTDAGTSVWKLLVAG